MQTNTKTVVKRVTSAKNKTMNEISYQKFLDLFQKQYSYHGYLGEEIRKDTIVHKEFLVSKGWVMCEYSGHLFPKDLIVELFSNYEGYQNNRKSFYSKKAVPRLVKDTYLNVSFGGQDIHKVVVNDKKYLFVNSHLVSKIETGEIYKNPARITRNDSLYTDFNHNYYDNKKAPKKWKIPDGDTYGIELEVKFPDAISKLRFSELIGVNFPNWCCERDGSLENIVGEGNSGEGGLELISSPMVFEDLVREIEEILPIMSKYKALGHDSGSELYGLHVTHGILNEKKRADISTAGNYIRFINDPRVSDFWRNFSRRQPNQFCLYIGNYEARLNSAEPLAMFTKSYDNSNHYNAICMREGCGAIETRIFRSTINPKTLVSSIEMVKLAHEASKTMDYDPVKYIQYIVDNGSRNLSKLLEKTSSLLSFQYLKVPNGDKYNEVTF